MSDVRGRGFLPWGTERVDRDPSSAVLPVSARAAPAARGSGDAILDEHAQVPRRASRRRYQRRAGSANMYRATRNAPRIKTVAISDSCENRIPEGS